MFKVQLWNCIGYQDKLEAGIRKPNLLKDLW